MNGFVRMIGKVLHLWTEDGKHYKARVGRKLCIRGNRVYNVPARKDPRAALKRKHS